MAFKGDFRPCSTCEHYFITASKKEGLIVANCRKYGMATEIKPDKILFCPIDKAEEEERANTCPVCGYGLRLIHSSKGDYNKCDICGYERAEPF